MSEEPTTPRMTPGDDPAPELLEAVERHVRAEMKPGGRPLGAYHAAGAVLHPEAGRLTQAIIADYEDRLVAIEEHLGLASDSSKPE